MENLFTPLNFIFTLSSTIAILYMLATKQKKFYLKNFKNINWILFCFLFFTAGWNLSSTLNDGSDFFVFSFIWTFYPAFAYLSNLFIGFNFVKK